MTAATLDVVSIVSAEYGPEILPLDAPVVGCGELVGGLGSRPTATFPLRRGRAIDTRWLRDFLGAPAEFFGLPLPPAAQFDDAVQSFAAAAFDRTGAELVTARMTLIDTGQLLVTGAPTAAFSGQPVEIGRLDPQYRWHLDSHWLAMAARTTSGGGVDHQLRNLQQQGCVDGIIPGPTVEAPLAGALVLDTGATTVGIDAVMIDQLHDCGVLRALPRTAAVPHAELQRAWWISPQFTTHPVAALAGRLLPVESQCPSFLELV